MKDSIHFCLDSISCVQETELVNDPRVHLLRLTGRLDDKEWYDGDVSLEDTVAMIKKAGKLPMTSQPPLGNLVELFTELSQQGKKIIFITVSSGLSGTYQTAAMAAKQVMQEVKGADIRVYDSKSGGLICTDATRLLLAKVEEGCEDMEELDAYAKDILSRTLTYYCVETLEHLRLGGRINKAGALIGGLLGIRPLLSLDEDGKVIPVDKFRTRKKLLKGIMDTVGSQGDLEYISVMGALCDEDVAYVGEEMQKRFPNAKVECCKLGSVLLIHLGAGVLGLFARKRKD